MPVPLIAVTPAGKVHEKLVAPNELVVRVAEVAPQSELGPTMVEGAKGFLVIVKLKVALLPQLLIA